MSVNTEQFLKTVPLFQDLDRKHQQVIAKTVFQRSYQPGEVIVKEGDPGVGVFMIASGQVEVVRQRGDQEEHLATLGPGQVFGEIALLTDLPRTATVRTTAPTTCYGLTAWNFRAELQRAPELSFQLLQVLARRLAEADQRLASR